MKRVSPWISLLIGLAAIPGRGAPLDVHAILQRSVEANERDWQAAPRYSYQERDKLQSGSRTYEIRMILGSPYRRLVAVNDEPVSRSVGQAEDQKLEKTAAQRKAESGSQHARRVGRYEQERRRDHLLIEQLTKAFDFTLLGTEPIDGRDAYKLRATRKAGYRPPVQDARVLTGMEGTLWIDRDTFQWVKVEAHVVKPVSIDGFLARVKPGTQFELEYTPVGPGVWLPKHFAVRSRTRVLFILNHRTNDDETYLDYHPAG